MKIIKVNTQQEAVEKQAELQLKIEAYKTAQFRQIRYGGPGPVADYDVMEIVNQYNSQFQVIVRELEIND